MSRQAPVDWDALDALYDEARSADEAGDGPRALALYNNILSTDPDDHLGVSLRIAHLTGSQLAAAPSAYVATLFDQIADRFDSILVDELGYAVPLMIADRLAGLGLGPFERWLDLGCGTGLCAMALEDMTRHRTGIDLAPTMVEIASELDLYDRLLVGDIMAYLESAPEDGPFDLITAADVLPYLGAIDPLLMAMAPHGKAGSLFVFSTEWLEEGTAEQAVGPHRRFAHTSSGLERALADHGWSIVERSAITVRHEQGAPVPGDLVIARLDER